MTSKPIKTHTFRGKRYKIEFLSQLYGFCEQPENPDEERLIVIALDQSDRDLLDTIIHESLHAMYPKMSEEDVLSGGKDIARLLWRLGYRQKSQGK